jgi:hypothetical protein
VRAYPKENFQTCYLDSDCNSKCCHNNFCTQKDTCQGADSTIPLIVFLVFVGGVLVMLAVLLGRDIIAYRKKKELDFL